jgi:hypothetical protein
MNYVTSGHAHTLQVLNLYGNILLPQISMEDNKIVKLFI